MKFKKEVILLLVFLFLLNISYASFIEPSPIEPDLESILDLDFEVPDTCDGLNNDCND